MALVALLEAQPADAVSVHAQMERRLHVLLAFRARQLLDQTLVVVRLEQRAQRYWGWKKGCFRSLVLVTSLIFVLFPNLFHC